MNGALAVIADVLQNPGVYACAGLIQQSATAVSHQ